MKEATFVTKDPICGMTVDEKTGHRAERDGETFYFCSEHLSGKVLVHHGRYQTGGQVWALL